MRQKNNSYEYNSISGFYAKPRAGFMPMITHGMNVRGQLSIATNLAPTRTSLSSQYLYNAKMQRFSAV